MAISLQLSSWRQCSAIHSIKVWVSPSMSMYGLFLIISKMSLPILPLKSMHFLFPHQLCTSICRELYSQRKANLWVFMPDKICFLGVSRFSGLQSLRFHRWTPSQIVLGLVGICSFLCFGGWPFLSFGCLQKYCICLLQRYRDHGSHYPHKLFSQAHSSSNFS